MRINLLDSRQLRSLVSDLLSGTKVRASEDEVQLTWAGSGKLSGKLRARDADPRTKSLLDIHLTALTQEEIDDLERADSRGMATDLPADWVTVEAETVQAWDLYNCRIESVLLDDNK